GAWRAGAFRLGASYEARRLGPGAGGGIVLHDRAELGWVEAGLAEPVILPWIFRYLGPFRISAYGSRLGADSIGPGAGFFAGDFAFQPHPRVTIGGHRSAVIVSEVDGERITFGDVLNILFDSGRTIPNFEDQKLSFGGSVRADLFGLTVTPYFVWGIEDTWELERDPGAILGAWVPAIPTAVGPLGLRYEYTAFGDPGENLWPWHGSWEWRNWYRHGSGRVLYVDNDGDLLGHPLGGYGTEHRLEASLPLPASGLLLSATLFTRHRDAGIYTNPNDGSTRPFSNILHDEMPGRSHGGTVAAVYSTPGFRVDGELGVEAGREGWDRVRASVGGKWLAW
ncbi:MAG: capsule assembly Wzi family protein, partial [Gemmatimonadota bacterium]